MARKRRGWGEGGIHHRPKEDRWEVFVSTGKKADGKYGRVRAFVKTKAEALTKLHELREQVRQGRLLTAEKVTVADYLSRWLAAVKPTVEDTTYASYEQHCRLHLVPLIGTVPLTKLSPFHVQQLYADLDGKGVSGAMRRKVGTTLAIALGQAKRHKLIADNPTEVVDKPKVSQPEAKVYDPEQVATFLKAAAADRLYALYLFAIDSGLRQGEIFGLQWADLDFGTGSVQVRRSLVNLGDSLRLKDTKSKAGRRRVQLSAFTVEALHDHRKRMLAEGFLAGPTPGAAAQGFDTPPVFCDTQGGYLRKTNFHRGSFQPLLKRTGLPKVRFHDLRHCCGTLLLLMDEGSKVVAERLGHASTRVTDDIYSHVLPTMQQRGAEKLDALFRRMLPPASGE